MSYVQLYKRKDFDKLSKEKATIEVEVRIGASVVKRVGRVHHPQFHTVWVGSSVYLYKQIKGFRRI